MELVGAIVVVSSILLVICMFLNGIVSIDKTLKEINDKMPNLVEVKND